MKLCSHALRALLPALLLLPLTGCLVMTPPVGGELSPDSRPVTPGAPAAETGGDTATITADTTPGVATVGPPATPGALVTVKAGGALRLEVIPQFDPITAASSRELNLLVRLTAEGTTPTARPPLDLAVVLDRSGSMAGDKLRDAKQAALDLLKQLEPRDRVTLISYDDAVVVHEKLRPVDPAGYEALRAAVLQVNDGGSTALGPATFTALEILEPAERGEKDIAHVLLLSDGIANVGEKRPEVIGARAAQGFAKGVSLSTLGVGLDYNEDLMTKLADQGGGRYHFIKNSNEIPVVLSEELAGLAATVARGIELTFQPGPNVEVAKVFGYPTELREGSTAIRVGALRAGQTREILVRLKLTSPAAPRAELGILGARFRDVTRDGDVEQTGIPLRVAVVDDSQLELKGERTAVTVRVAELESAEEAEEAARAVGRGDYQQATQLLNTSLEKVKKQKQATPSKELDAQEQELEQALTEVEKAKTDTQQRKVFEKQMKAKSYQLKKK